MRVKCLQETDALYIEFIEFRADRVLQACDLDENTLLAPDDEGRVCALTMEHSSQRADGTDFSYEQIAP